MRKAWMAVALTAGLAALAPPAVAQGKWLRYDPSQRQRTAMDTCLKDEVMNGAWCVKKCQADFRMDLTSRPPSCIATKPNAKYVPTTPTWKAPDAAPAAPSRSAGPGA